MSEYPKKPVPDKEESGYAAVGYFDAGEKPRKEFTVGQPLSEQKMNSTQYPEAVPVAYDGNDEPVDGEMLYPPPPPGSEERSNPHLRRFVKKGWKDIWAAVVFLLCASTVSIVGIVNYFSFYSSDFSSDSNSIINDEDAAGFTSTESFFIFFGTLLSFFSVFVDLFLLSKYPKRIIYVANIFSVAMICTYALICCFAVNPIIGLLLLIMAFFNVLWFYYARARIPFSAVILRTATNVVKKHKKLLICQLFMLVVSLTFLYLWVYALIPTMYRADSEAITGWDRFITLFSVFTLFWVMQVVVNVVLVTTCGVVATWYFVGGENMPKSPIWKCFLRSITTSFGSICFGSLLLASLQFLRWLVAVSQRNGEQNFLTCILDCILAMLQGIVAYVNRYAYVHIAMYGYDYLTAAKHTFELFNQCLISGLFNDCLVDSTLNLLNISFSLLLGLFCGLCTFSFGVGALTFFIALVIRSLMLSSVSSAVLTIFVCYAEVPEALAASDPELYNLFVEGDGGATNNALPV